MQTPHTCRITVISGQSWQPSGLRLLSELSNTTDTVALVIPAWPCLLTSSWRLEARTCCKLVMPNTKQMESRMLDLPKPLRSVMALKQGSKHDRASGVGFEVLQADLLYVHYWDEVETLRGRAEEGGFGDGNPIV